MLEYIRTFKSIKSSKKDVVFFIIALKEVCCNEIKRTLHGITKWPWQSSIFCN